MSGFASIGGVLVFAVLQKPRIKLALVLGSRLPGRRRDTVQLVSSDWDWRASSRSWDLGNGPEPRTIAALFRLALEFDSM